MTDRLTLVALLYVESERREEYERFEHEAARIMRRHGGRIERRIDLDPSGPGGSPDAPDEVHVVTFPDVDRFQAYRSDPDLTALGELRERAIRRTVVWWGADAPPFR